MITESKYYQSSKTDKVWYDSSNIIYSEFKDGGNGKGQLFVTFKNGSTYHYKDVDLSGDYMLFKHGGTNPDMSNGKALNQFIKGKYDFERVSDKEIAALMEEYQKTKEYNSFFKDKENVYFIYGEAFSPNSGRDIITDYYSPRIQAVSEMNPHSKFILTNDTFGVAALDNMRTVLDIDASRIRVYCTDNSERITPETSNGLTIDGTFNSKQEMLEQMTRDSGHDIICLTNAETLTDSAKCILRRHLIF